MNALELLRPYARPLGRQALKLLVHFGRGRLYQVVQLGGCSQGLTLLYLADGVPPLDEGADLADHPVGSEEEAWRLVDPGIPGLATFQGLYLIQEEP